MVKNKILDGLIYLAKTIVLLGVLLVITVVLSQELGALLGEKELELIENEQVIPLAMLELIGMQALQQVPADIEVFFLIIMVLNLVVIGKIMGHSIEVMRNGVRKGAFSFLYVQTMHVWVYFVRLVLSVLVMALVTWGLYIAGVFVCSSFVFTGLEAVFLTNANVVLSTMAFRGLGVLVLMVSFSVICGVKQIYSMDGVDFTLCVMGVSFVLGNAYKIPQLIGQKQIEQMVNAQQMMEITRGLKEIRFLCPYSWLNPFNIHNRILSTRMIWSYVLVAVAIMIMAGVIFCLRDWEEV
ncbi:MAG: hypothetical protein IJ958_05230 [Agathobacter sp.]|nr:hypothetical protein [Agathobacter sp.]